MHKLILTFALLSLVVACDKKTEPKAAPDTPETKEAPKEKPKEKVKITFALQPQENPKALKPEAKKFEAFIEEKTGYDVDLFIPTTYSAGVDAMKTNKAQVAYLDSWPYLAAHMTADADLLLVEERDGNPFYHSQFYVLKQSKIKKVESLKGKKIAFTLPTSTSGYLVPMAELVTKKVVDPQSDASSFKNFQFAGSPKASLKTLLDGKVDAVALSEDELKKFLKPEEQDKVRVLHKQPVPTPGLAIRSDVKKEVRETLKNALLELNKDENKELLKNVIGVQKLVERGHYNHVKDIEKAQETVGHEYPLARPKKDGAAKSPMKKAEPKKPATSGSK